jgi:hypothetical protein
VSLTIRAEVYCRWQKISLLLTLVLFVGTTVPAQAGEGGVADTRERFFGAVQSIYNPDRAAQAGVQWERLIFP